MKATKAILVVIVLAAIAAAAFVTLRPREEPDEVLVLCGGSMRAVLEEILQRYRKVSDNTVMATYGGSGDLCAQLQQTHKGDVYLCHDPFMPWGEKQGFIDTWQTVGYLDVVMIVPKGNPKDITELKDMATPGLRVGIGNQTYSTSGQLVKGMFEKLPYGKDIIKNVWVETKGHQSRCNDVAMETLDASIVWAPVAHLFKDKLEIFPIPKQHIDSVTSATYGASDFKNVQVTVGITSYAKDKKHVREFYEFFVKESPKVFKEFGFRISRE